MEVVRQLMGSHLSDELIAEMEEEALNEIGIIILNACIGAIATALDKKFDVELPIFERGSPMGLLKPPDSSEGNGILLIRIRMDLSECKVNGYLAFILGPTSQKNLQESLKIMIEKISG